MQREEFQRKYGTSPENVDDYLEDIYLLRREMPDLEATDEEILKLKESLDLIVNGIITEKAEEQGKKLYTDFEVLNPIQNYKERLPINGKIEARELYEEINNSKDIYEAVEKLPDQARKVDKVQFQEETQNLNEYITKLSEKESSEFEEQEKRMKLEVNLEDITNENIPSISMQTNILSNKNDFLKNQLKENGLTETANALIRNYGNDKKNAMMNITGILEEKNKHFENLNGVPYFLKELYSEEINALKEVYREIERNSSDEKYYLK